MSDGRRQTDPLKNLNGSPETAPRYQLLRQVISSDPAPSGGYLPASVDGAQGANWGSFNEGFVQAIPRSGLTVEDTIGGTSTVTITLYEWAPGAERWIPIGQTEGPGGAGEPVRLAFEAKGRKVFPHISGVTAGQSVSVYVSGYEKDATL